MRTSLITGGAHGLGPHLAEAVLERGDAVREVSNVPSVEITIFDLTQPITSLRPRGCETAVAIARVAHHDAPREQSDAFLRSLPLGEPSVSRRRDGRQAVRAREPLPSVFGPGRCVQEMS